MAAASRPTLHLSARESEARRREFREEQRRRDAARIERIRAVRRRRNRTENLKAAGVIGLILAFFGLVFLAAMFNLVTRPVDLIPALF